jgi:hypothetical protein
MLDLATPLGEKPGNSATFGFDCPDDQVRCRPYAAMHSTPLTLHRICGTPTSRPSHRWASERSPLPALNNSQRMVGDTSTEYSRRHVILGNSRPRSWRRASGRGRRFCRGSCGVRVVGRSRRRRNASSIAGVEGEVYPAGYCAAKHGLVGPTRALATSSPPTACASTRCAPAPW